MFQVLASARIWAMLNSASRVSASDGGWTRKGAAPAQKAAPVLALAGCS